MDEGAHGDRKDHRAYPKGPSQQDPDNEYDDLDDKPDDPNGHSLSAEARHESITRSGSEVGADVETRANANGQNACDEERPTGKSVAGRFNLGDGQIDKGADQESVEDRADAKALAQRYPQHHDGERDADCPPAQGSPKLHG